jgi:hypothetical protein
LHSFSDLSEILEERTNPELVIQILVGETAGSTLLTNQVSPGDLWKALAKLP